MDFNSFWNFEKMLTPVLVRLAYRVVAVILIIAGVIFLFTAPGGLRLLAFVGVPLALVLWRIICEQGLILFSIRDELHKANSK